MSAAVGEEIITRIVGYAQLPGNFAEVSPNLPIRVLVPGEVNEANQATINTALVQVTSVAQAAALAGWGSPLYQIAKILFPQSGGGIGGIPVYFAPQAKAVGSAAKVMTITATAAGGVTENGTHYVKVAGRTAVEGKTYAVNLVAGDTVAIIHSKIADAMNGVLGSPMSSVGAAGQATCTSKWFGLTSQDITLTMDTRGNDLGVTYAYATTTPGSGTPDIQDALDLAENQWFTHVINTYGTVADVMDALEAYNGRPATITNPPSGRYSGTVYKPLVAFTGSVVADPSAITDARLNDCTIKISPAPLSPGLPMEAAANDCLRDAVCRQNTPHLDTCGQSYSDMPVPADGNIGFMSNWQNRQIAILKGCSTVDLIGGEYVIMDPVTTFHPIGETLPQYRYVRNLVIDWNIEFGYRILVERYVTDHVIANDNEKVAATKVIKPKTFKGYIGVYAGELSLRALVVDIPFTTASIVTGISTTNADRLSAFFKYKRSGYARVVDTTAEAGFNQGSLTAN